MDAVELRSQAQVGAVVHDQLRRTAEHAFFSSRACSSITPRVAAFVAVLQERASRRNQFLGKDNQVFRDEKPAASTMG